MDPRQSAIGQNRGYGSGEVVWPVHFLTFGWATAECTRDMFAIEEDVDPRVDAWIEITEDDEEYDRFLAWRIKHFYPFVNLMFRLFPIALKNYDRTN